VDWDHRYSGEQIWSDHPNGALVDEVAGLTPGRALDVGAGEGGGALSLAERDWTLTASDISRRGLERIDAEDARRGLSTATHCDANSLDAFETGAFDLVVALYASIPRTPDGRGIRSSPGSTTTIFDTSP